ncbi:N-acetylmuramoyl-L-alanine amidase [Sphingobacterium yanglingense]|uniref:N-acetylmuramoyl-L-alanine amidase n=1 Tax=Sphingobacterium yanglingense TaxID=1437280 RepID=A0A4R6WCY1_9SPHI|nr:N-acetylmuramoyl-L-alanine amidase [Sphingobacterium yanglingense]TDQ77465.1 N-acetylmuramoyl-L-alanine amidase [Sphingobacterium yanglingense]
MKVTNHRLTTNHVSEKIKHETTKNKGGRMNPQFIIIHFTAGSSATSSINWFKNPNARASAHIVIARDGTITQLVDFNQKAWHAGQSQWANFRGFNDFSIGIELDNPGRLHKVGNRYLSWFKQEYPIENVVEARHKHESTPSFWYEYTQEQIEACFELCQTLTKKYNIQIVLGHDDIAPYRKDDPGPLFPMESFKAKLFGRTGDSIDTYTVNTDKVNVRKGPGTSFESYGTLSKGSKVEFVKSQNEWFLVSLLENKFKDQDVTSGWIHSRLLQK